MKKELALEKYAIASNATFSSFSNNIALRLLESCHCRGKKIAIDGVTYCCNFISYNYSCNSYSSYFTFTRKGKKFLG